MDVVLYIHGKDGSAEEAEHYKTIFSSCDVIGFDYKSFTPWGTREEIREEISTLKSSYNKVILEDTDNEIEKCSDRYKRY